MTNTIHAHVHSYSTDCDGPITREYVMVPDLCPGSGTPAGVASACSVCKVSFGFPHPFGGVVGRTLPKHLGEFGDVEFHNTVVGHVVTSYGSYRGGELTVEVDDEYGNVTLHWSEPTEEGGRSVTAVFCDNNDCDVDARLYRDHQAEEAGY